MYLAELLKINPAIIGMFIIGLGTVLPELFFSIKASRENHDSLALGDILGTVIADATIVVGIVATISPFAFNPRIVYLTGIFMLISIIVLLYMMKTNRTLSKKESLLLLSLYIIFVLFELFVFAQ